jgi:hypothetical protein
VNAFLNKLFGLQSMGFGDPDVQLGFARPMPPWAWALAVLVAAAVSFWSYSRLTGSRPGRMALATLRGLLLLLLLVLICGPQLVRPNERVEKDWVLVLLDRSASMTIADTPAAGGTRETRDKQLRDAISAAWPAFTQLAKDRTVVWLGFDSGVFDLKLAEQGGAATGLEFGEPAGRRTSLGSALEQALARAAARPLSGVLVVSDGRSADEPSHSSIKRLRAQQIPVYTLALGSPDPVADLAVHAVESPAMAFLNDTVPVTVEIDRLGSAPPGGGSPGSVQLVERGTGLVLDERPMPDDPASWADGRARVTLTTRPALAGKSAWIVRLVPRTPDLIDQNNQSELAIELIDRPLRVAQFDGYPRWEFRYLKNLLLREKSIRSASLLLASNRQYLQEGEIVLDGIPRSPEEWAQFDVIILGDLSGSMFSRDQLEQLKEHVAVRGGGLLWIGGPGSTPGSWRETPLADLLPFVMSSGSGPGDQTVRAADEPVVMIPAPAATRLNLLELGETPADGWPIRLSDPATGWSQLQYSQRIDPAAVKPTAEVLAYFAPASTVTETSSGSDLSPAVLSMRYGAGRVLYVATDEIWRWRYARGEALPERFWLPLIRLQGRESLARASRPATLEVSPRRPEVDQPVRMAVVLLDQALVDAAPATLTVRIRRDDATGPATSELTLAPEQVRSAVRGATRSYATTWVPSEPGKYRLEVADPLLASLGLTSDVEVTLPDDELRRPESDHPLLAKLSQETTGQVLTASRLTELPGLLPNREVHITGTPDIQPLWDKPLSLILLLLVLTAEWVGRRLLKLA